MKWLCYLFGHYWKETGSTIYTDVNFTKRHWECKICKEKEEDTIWHDI